VRNSRLTRDEEKFSSASPEAPMGATSRVREDAEMHVLVDTLAICENPGCRKRVATSGVATVAFIQVVRRYGLNFRVSLDSFLTFLMNAGGRSRRPHKKLERSTAR
jgi:hypothetical protein